MAQPAHILICDDEAHILHVLSLKLREAGFDVSAAADGMEAYEIAVARPPRLVITDYLMPGGDGLALCRRLRAHPPTAAVPLVLLTGRGSSLSDDDLGEIDFAAILSKPFSPRDVLRLTLDLTRQPTAGGAA